MAARFERHISRRPARHFARLPQRMHFGMRFARFDMKPLPDDLAAVCNHAADARVGRSGKTPEPRKGKGVFASLGINTIKHNVDS